MDSNTQMILWYSNRRLDTHHSLSEIHFHLHNCICFSFLVGTQVRIYTDMIATMVSATLIDIIAFTCSIQCKSLWTITGITCSVVVAYSSSSHEINSQIYQERVNLYSSSLLELRYFVFAFS